MPSQLYKKSNYIQSIKGNNGSFLIYHSLFNHPREINDSIWQLIESFVIPTSLSEIYDNFDGDVNEVIDDLIKLHFIVPAEQDERQVLQSLQENFIDNVTKGSQLARLELAISNSCNFGCQHCMHFVNNEFPSRIHPSMHMSVDTAKNSIDIFIEQVKKTGHNSVRVHFGNGEPLMNWATLVFAIEYCESIKDINFSYALNTNLSLLDQKKAELLKKYKVKISTSLDGLKEANDLIRIDQQGQGTFDTIVSKMQLLKSIDYPIDGFTITVTGKNFTLIDERVIDFGLEMGVKDISMDFDLVSSTNIPPEDCNEKIIRLRQYAHQKGLNFYGTWETPYRNLMSSSWLDSPYAFCPAMEGKTLEFNVDGSLKTCGHTNTVVGYAEKIDECFLPDSKYTELIKSRQPGNNDFCRGCEIEGCCAGQCHVTLESARKDKEVVSQMCDLMRITTKSLIIEYLEGR